MSSCEFFLFTANSIGIGMNNLSLEAAVLCGVQFQVISVTNVLDVGGN